MAREDTLTAPAKAPKRHMASFNDQMVEPLSRLRGEVDRLFENFPFRFPMPQISRADFAVPALEIKETDKAYKVSAELPGIDSDDVEITFENGVLRIAGEKKEEHEENERGYHLSERSYGSFQRQVELPKAADGDAIEARFRKGVLTVIVPKDKKASSARKIAISKG